MEPEISMEHTAGGGRRPLHGASADDLLACIRAAQAGDRVAGRALVEYLLPVVRARVARVLRRYQGAVDRARLDDGEQDAWAKVWPAIGRWSPSGGRSLANWVGWAAENATRNAIDRRRPDRSDDAIDPDGIVGAADPVGEASVRRRTDPERLCPCLHSHCTERDLVIARMLQLDGTAPADVARALGTSPGQVYKSSHRFKAALQACIAE